MENKEATQYIENINIKGLWGRYDVDWQLHADVNILVGENGTGKSTILKGIMELLWLSDEDLKDSSVFKNYKPVFDSLEITDVYISDVRLDVKQKHVYKLENNPEVHITVNYINPKTQSVTKKFDKKPFAKTFFSGFAEEIARKNSYKSPYTEKLNINYIVTFDSPFYSKTDKELNRKPYIKSTLDDELDVLIDKYVEYQLNQNKKLRFNGNTYESVFANQKYFIETINRLFINTEKKIDEEENRLSFLTIDNRKITPFELSSGEKQLLIIFLTVLCQDKLPTILLLDEPEISLHITWQYELINIIRQLNPNCQLIIATHSTSIFTKGWMNKLFFMDGVEGIRHKIAQHV